MLANATLACVGSCSPEASRFNEAHHSVNLYRIMADVRAGSGQPNIAHGEFGIATLWVSAESEPVALAKGAAVLTNRRYEDIGALRCYLEEMVDDPLASATEEERAFDRRAHSVVAGYDAIKEQALARSDGLHELWLGRIGHQTAHQQHAR